ncbi:MAG: hypothetical protein MZV70_18710 [Desulfobacterales bacterium]|nr:hypothetical protein [Desulfobacterales bacterium]
MAKLTFEDLKRIKEKPRDAMALRLGERPGDDHRAHGHLRHRRRRPRGDEGPPGARWRIPVATTSRSLARRLHGHVCSSEPNVTV